MPKSKKASKRCCICIETIQPEKEARISSCRHRYCKRCISKWSRVKNRCPQCKRRFNWIIHVQSKRKERVVKRHETMIDFMVVLLRSFLYNSDFRGMMAQGIANANHHALSLFDFLYTIVIDFDIKNIVRETNNVKQAFLWLANMRQITSV